MVRSPARLAADLAADHAAKITFSRNICKKGDH
jgi:hypothetical protein